MEDAPDNISCGTMLKCWAGTCRYNANGLCAFKGIEIGKDGNGVVWVRAASCRRMRSEMPLRLLLQGYIWILCRVSAPSS